MCQTFSKIRVRKKWNSNKFTSTKKNELPHAVNPMSRRNQKHHDGIRVRVHMFICWLSTCALIEWGETTCAPSEWGATICTSFNLSDLSFWLIVCVWSVSPCACVSPGPWTSTTLWVVETVSMFQFRNLCVYITYSIYKFIHFTRVLKELFNCCTVL